MIYLRYVALLSLTFVFCNANGIINTQTVIVIKKEQALKKLKIKQKEVEEEIEKYADSIARGNDELKKSIKILKALIEIKKDALLATEEVEHHTKFIKR